jgi:translocation and assembly module TamA
MDRFKSLSTLLKGGRKAANASQVSARADEDVALIERLLRSEGYFDGVATATIEPQTAPGEVKVAIIATPGPRYVFDQIAVTGAEPKPTELARGSAGPEERRADRRDRRADRRGQFALRLPEQGYPFATVGARDIVLDDVRPAGDYTLPIDAGRLSSFGGFQAAGDPVFDTDHIALLARFDPGEIYDSREVDDLRQALVATSLFSTVAVQPVRPGGPPPTDRDRGPARGARLPARSGRWPGAPAMAPARASG